MINPYCGGCGIQLYGFPAMLFSSPSKEDGKAEVWGLCARCFKKIEDTLILSPNLPHISKRKKKKK